MNRPLSMALGAVLMAAPAWAQNARPAAAAPPSSSSPEPSIAPVVDHVKGTVVRVMVKGHGGVQPGPGMVPLPFEPNQIHHGLGSGVVIDPSGLVVTNNHVVEGADSIEVRTDDGRKFVGHVLGGDPDSDVALLQLEGTLTGLHAARLGDSDSLHVGDYVVAIGNPFGLSLTVTLGIVSALGRQIGASNYDDFIQTDAAINPGNSGGPLLNLKGEVVGINAAIVQGGQGIGFAVPINMVKALLPQLKKGKVVRGYIGVVAQDLTPELSSGLGIHATQGALISEVHPDSPAAKAGLQPGDVIESFGGQTMTSASQLSRQIATLPPRSRQPVRYTRGSTTLTGEVVLATKPVEAPETASEEPGQDHALTKGHIGMAMQDVSASDAHDIGLPDSKAVVIVRVEPGSSADDAGLQPGDAILQIGKTPTTSARQVVGQLKRAKPGTQVVMRVQRRDEALFVSLPIPVG